MRLGPRRKRNKKDFWARQAMATTAAGQAAGEHSVKARRWRRLVKANFIAFPPAVLALVIALAQLITTQAGDQPQAFSDSEPTAVRAQALDTVSDWLSSDKSPLTEAKVEGWDGAEKLEWPETTEKKDRTYQVWVARVLVSTDSNNYVAGVQVTVDDEGTSVTGAPSLEAIPSTANKNSISDGSQWPGTSAVPASDAVTRAVQAWADAYVSGNSTTLTTIMADPDTKHSYIPISGFTSVTATVNTSAYHAYSKGNKPDESQLMVSVTLACKRDGQSQLAQLTFDLLVADPTTGSAKVTAWGAPGSGPTLTPYTNAITTSDTEGTATPMPSITPGTTPTPTAKSSPSSSATSTPTTTATKKEKEG